MPEWLCSNDCNSLNRFPRQIIWHYQTTTKLEQVFQMFYRCNEIFLSWRFCQRKYLTNNSGLLFGSFIFSAHWFVAEFCTREETRGYRQYNRDSNVFDGKGGVCSHLKTYLKFSSESLWASLLQNCLIGWLVSGLVPYMLSLTVWPDLRLHDN